LIFLTQVQAVLLLSQFLFVQASLAFNSATTILASVEIFVLILLQGLLIAQDLLLKASFSFQNYLLALDVFLKYPLLV
jgi:hypothetical protein